MSFVLPAILPTKSRWDSGRDGERCVVSDGAVHDAADSFPSPPAIRAAADWGEAVAASNRDSASTDQQPLTLPALRQRLESLEVAEAVGHSARMRQSIVTCEQSCRNALLRLEAEQRRDWGDERLVLIMTLWRRGLLALEQCRRVELLEQERVCVYRLAEQHRVEATETLERRGLCDAEDAARMVLLVPSWTAATSFAPLQSSSGMGSNELLHTGTTLDASEIVGKVSTAHTAFFPVLATSSITTLGRLPDLSDLAALVQVIAPDNLTPPALDSERGVPMSADLHVRAVLQTQFRRERCMLDAAAFHHQHKTECPAPLSRKAVCCLPGLIVPWEFVLEERAARQGLWHRWERSWCEVDARGALERCVVRLEAEQRRRLRWAYLWASEHRLACVLLLQRFFRFRKTESLSRRRARWIREERQKMERARFALETAQELAERAEKIEDATLRDVWAEDYETGEVGLFFPFRKQLLEIAAERAQRALYTKFVASLQTQAMRFVRQSYAELSRRMHILLFVAEPHGREAVVEEERRFRQATRKQMTSLERCILTGGRQTPELDEEQGKDSDSETTGGVGAAARWYSLVDSASAEAEAASARWYASASAGDHRRVAFCRDAWRMFRFDESKLLREHHDDELYMSLTATRVPSAHARRTPSSIMERIPSAGYQRAGSAAYRRLSSAGVERLGSAGYHRLGSAGSSVTTGAGRSNHGRIGSAIASRQASSTSTAPHGKRLNGSKLPLFWEGYQCVIDAKRALVQREEAGRDAILDAFQRHVQFAHLFRFLLKLRPDLLVVGGQLDTACRELSHSEQSARLLLHDDEDAERVELRRLAVIGRDAAELLAVPSPWSAVREESEERHRLCLLESAESDALARYVLPLARALLKATEHLRRTGMVPRAPGEGRRQSVRRLSSVLQSDALSSRRRNFCSVEAVCVVIQRWWREAHFHVYRVAQAGRDMLLYQRAKKRQDESVAVTASVVQMQLRDINEDQLLHRRISSARSSPPPPTSATPSSPRTRSALSTLRKTSVSSGGRARPITSADSLRTVLSNRAIHTVADVSSSWANLAAEETVSRNEWMLVERVGREALQRFYHNVIIGTAVHHRVIRLVSRMEPVNRLRLEREQLHAFVALFLSPEAEYIRASSVIEGELRKRAMLVSDERFQWNRMLLFHEAHRLAECRLSGATQSRYSEGSLPRSHAEKGMNSDADALLWNLSLRNRRVALHAENPHRALPVMSVGAAATPSDGTNACPNAVLERCLGREAIARRKVEHWQADDRLCAVASGCLAVCAHKGIELLAALRRTFEMAAMEFDLTPPRRELPIAQILWLGLEEKRTRAGLVASVPSAVYSAPLLLTAQGFAEVLYTQAQRRWLMSVGPFGLRCLEDVLTALLRRVGRFDTKTGLCAEVEMRHRRVLIALEEVERTLRSLDATIGTLVYRMWLKKW